MDWLLKVVGIIISLGFLYIGFRFTFFPKKSIQSLQQLKYKATGEPGKRERIFSLVMGILLLLIGLYYLIMVILSIIYPA